ncbi:unnamed protein product [Moneuplotes crassus]|uniref:Exonuclease domain-containing protein n=1 Tax=Euplotes crassus TaxID=5936 RepID=A0AAD1Y7E0_EUPCR|nr:unnamed protein product [Moneuplotes crassus]
MEFDQKTNSYKKKTGHIDYENIKYDLLKSYRNRVFMGKFDCEFNNGFGNKYYNTLNIGKAKVRNDFKNWNNSIGYNFKPMHGKIFRRIVYQTVAQTFQQDQILRDIIENKEHLDTDKIVAIDVEYGGGKTIPRVGICNFNEECIYYSDFCLRYNDWEETKKLLREDREKSIRNAEKILERNKNRNNLEKIAKEEYQAQSKGTQGNTSTKASTDSKKKQADSDYSDYDEIDKEFDEEFGKELKDIKQKNSNFSIDIDGKKVHKDQQKHDATVENASTTINDIFAQSKKKPNAKIGQDALISEIFDRNKLPKLDKQKSELKQKKKSKDEDLCLTSDSEENDLKNDLDEEEIKEIKEMQDVEGMLDDDNLQNELAITDSEEEGDDNKQDSANQPQAEITSSSDTNTTKKEDKVPQYVIAGNDNNDDEEWILDHTGTRRKPFKVMHREIREIIKDKIVIAHNLPKDFAYLRITRHDCKRTLDTSLIKMFQKKNLRRKLRDLTLEYVDARIQLTSNHSPVEDAIACMRIFKVFAREIGIFNVKMVYNQLWGSKEARFIDPPDIKKPDLVCGPYSDIFKCDYETLGEDTKIIGIAVNWGINEENEKEILRVSIVNEHGHLLFDSIIQPSLTICYVPLYYGYLYDPSFGIPLKYLSDMLNVICDGKIIVGYGIQKVLEMLSIKSVYTVRDLITHEEIGVTTVPSLAQKFYGLDLDLFFRSTITEARLYIGVYKSMKQEFEDKNFNERIMKEHISEEGSFNHESSLPVVL